MKSFATSIAVAIFITGIAIFALLFLMDPTKSEAASYCDTQGDCTGPSANDWYAYERVREYTESRYGIPTYRTNDYYRDYRNREPYNYNTYRYDCPLKYRHNDRLCAKHQYEDYEYEEYDDGEEWWYRYEYRYR